MTAPIDLSTYARAPRMDVPTAVALGIALLAAPAPSNTAAMKKARARVRTSVVALQRAWAKRDKQRAQAEPLDPRSADLRVDAVWGAIYNILDALAGLPAQASARFALAAKFRTSLFPDGKTFLTLPYPSEWAESQKRLDRIEAEGLADDLTSLVGSDVVQELRDAHAAYGEAVGKIMRGEGKPDSVTVREPLEALASAITDYAVKVLATLDPEDPTTTDTVKMALKPFDVVRERASRGSALTGDTPNIPPADPATPVPEEA